jgi:hypothetical protein
MSILHTLIYIYISTSYDIIEMDMSTLRILVWIKLVILMFEWT